MSQFRSEEMRLIQLFIQSDAAHDTLHELGQVGAIQFKDLNTDKSAFQRTFVQDVRKCEDMLRILRYLNDLILKDKVPTTEGAAQSVNSLNELHEKLQDLEKEMKEHTASYATLLKQRNELEEHMQVLNNAAKWFGQANRSGISFTAPTDAEDSAEMSSLLDDTEAGVTRRSPSMLGHIAGCIPTANVREFAVTLFRATRGNMHLQQERLEASSESEADMKSVFIVYFSGERSRQKIEKICESYGATKYRLPDSAALQDKTEADVRDRLRDLEVVIRSTSEYRRRKLSSIASSVEGWDVHVSKEKAIFHTLNLFNYDVTHKCLIAYGWCPVDSMPEIREALRRGSLKSGASVQTVLNVVKTNEMPPTFFRSSKLTVGFQNIVDAYGIARYQEFNPAVFAVITFPFLFGVMFGDIGHGFMMSLVGALLCIFEKPLAALARDEMFGMLYGGRYNILLMGLFATYAGFIYNEIFSVPQPLFAPTMWCSGEMENDPQCLHVAGIDANTSTQKWLRTNINEAYDFKKQETTEQEVVWDVYPMGGDPGWAHTANKLNAGNSFKMKFAIVAGVVQMVAGVCCKLMNTLFFRDSLTLYFVFLPEIVFINSIFGYLVMLIMSKWTTNWDATYILNNNEVVHIPQIYCKPDLSNVPCWTAPFHLDAATIPGYGAELAALPEHMWCMKKGVATAGCAVYNYMGRTIVESNTYGNNTMIDDRAFSAATCEAGLDGCIMYKQDPPSLLDTLIKMFMEPGYVSINNQLIPGQGPLQALLILIAFISVPMLLLPKPLILKARHEAKQKYGLLDENARHPDEESGGGGHDDHGDEFEFGEVMVHQMIHTIEYVLGCVSNTASYLRLWALSLAHAQLSEVFWEKTVVEIGLGSASPGLIFVTVFSWSLFTVGVLMGMESLSAFLHALRLHWVEFMNKFYNGDGYQFRPFSFALLDEPSD